MEEKSTAESAENAEKPDHLSANSACTAAALSVVKILLRPAQRRQKIIVALLHLAALGLTARLAHWPYHFVLTALALVIIPLALYSHLARPASRLTFNSFLLSLSPLFILYLVTALRLALALVVRVLCPNCYTYLAVPEPFASWLSFEWTAIFCLVAVIVVQCAQLLPAEVGARLAAFALASLVALWAILLYPRLIPAGVTGADPFAYVQMAVDLAARHTPMHRFPLADLARGLNLPVYPTLFVGYTVPHNSDSAAVWPPGFSVLLAITYTLLGERGLYLFNPFLGLLSLLATAAFARRIFGLSLFYSVLAATFLLISSEQTIRLSVPLADIAVQFFTLTAVTVAVGFTTRAPQAEESSNSTYLRTLLCGALAALAFVIRYTQLLLVPGLLYALYRRAQPQTHAPLARRWPSLFIHFLLFMISFFIGALPDTLYRTLAFGSPLSFAAGELAQFSATDIYPVALRLLTDLIADFGLLTLFVVLGITALLRSQPALALVLILVLGPVILFHLPYHYLKLRDLLFLLPFLCAFAAMGIRATIARWHKALANRSFVVGHLSFVILFIPLASRFASQLPLLGGYYTYGFLTVEERAHVESIAELTPPNAVLAASLNSGAISLYAQREIFRPGRLLQPGRTWTDGELVTFVRALHERGRPIYLLADSQEMIDPIAALESCCILTPVAELYLPYYYPDGSATHEIIPLYRIDLK